MLKCAHRCAAHIPHILRRPACQVASSECISNFGQRQLQAISRLTACPYPRGVLCAATRAASPAEHKPASSESGSVSPAGGNAKSNKEKSFQLQFSEKSLPRSRKQFTVTIPAAALKTYFDIAERKARDGIAPDGFRKGGKIPDFIRYSEIDGGIDAVKALALDSLLNRALPEVLAKYEDIAFADSLSFDTPQAELIAAYNVKQPLTFQLSIDIAPELRWKSPYRDMKIEVEAPTSEKDEAVSIERMIERFREDHGSMRIVQGRGLQRGDIAMVAFDAKRNGTPIPGAAQSKMRLETATSDETYIPGLAAGMEGMHLGESRVIPARFPDDWVPEQLAGWDVECSVTLKELFTLELAELNDALVKQHFPDSDNVDDFKRQLAEAVKLEAGAQMHTAVVDKLAEAIAERVDADIPETLIRTTGEQDFQAHLLRLQEEEKVKPEVLASLATEEMMANYINHNHERIEKVTRSTMGFESIFQAEGLQVDDEELQEEIASGAEQFESSGVEYDKERLREQAFETVKGNTTVRFLESVCSIQINPKT